LTVNTFRSSTSAWQSRVISLTNCREVSSDQQSPEMLFCVIRWIPHFQAFIWHPTRLAGEAASSIKTILLRGSQRREPRITSIAAVRTMKYWETSALALSIGLLHTLVCSPTHAI